MVDPVQILLKLRLVIPEDLLCIRLAGYIIVFLIHTSDLGLDERIAFLVRFDMQRSVFLRRYWFYDSVKDVAERFGFSETKTKVLLFRLRKKLKERLTAEGISL